jgi:long-subunit acyl-CoA synthetase (AMP-forming)
MGNYSQEFASQSPISIRSTALVRMLFLTHCSLAYSLMTDDQLKVQPGDRVVLCYDFGLEFYVAFWACLSLGLIAVPVCPADPTEIENDLAKKLHAILQDSKPVCVLTDKVYLKSIQLGVKMRAREDDFPFLIKVRCTTSYRVRDLVRRLYHGYQLAIELLPRHRSTLHSGSPRPMRKLKKKRTRRLSMRHGRTTQ